MKFVADFNAFLRDEVNLNQARLDRLQGSVDAIETFLVNHPTFADSFPDLIPAGSWAQRAIIRPVTKDHEFDADVLLSMTEQEDWQPKDYIEQLWTAFRSSSTYHDLAHRKTRCVRIDYAGDFHIDVVPYLERWGAQYITNRYEPEDMGRFELSNPEAFTAWVDERQRLSGRHFIKVVRLMKYLRDFKGTFSCKSIILLTLLGDRITESDIALAPECYADVPTTLVTLIGKLAEWLPEALPDVYDPGGTGDNFSARYAENWNYSNFRTRIIDYAEQMKAAYEEAERNSAIARWQAIFGTAFKQGTTEKALRTLTPSYPASVPHEGERFIDQPPFSFPIQPKAAYRAYITGRVTGMSIGGTTRRNGFRQFELPKHGNMVPKRRSILFTMSTDVPAPYTAYWKVRNGGDEAAQQYALRGEITADTGAHAKEETTSYAGTHYVECYVVKDGAVVASDRQQVIVTLA